jgi:hypothetical protein
VWLRQQCVHWPSALCLISDSLFATQPTTMLTERMPALSSLAPCSPNATPPLTPTIAAARPNLMAALTSSSTVTRIANFER